MTYYILLFCIFAICLGCAAADLILYAYNLKPLKYLWIILSLFVLAAMLWEKFFPQTP